MTTFIGRLTDEELNQLRAVEGRVRAIEMNPDRYSAEETERALIAEWRLNGQIARDYDIDDTRKWMVSPSTGTLAYGGEWAD